MTRDAYADRCEDLFALGGFREARKAAEAGLAELGPDPVLYRWLGLAHAAEDDDDRDADAEAAYEAGLAQWPDDLGLLVSYLELCLRADTWSYPGRAARVERLKERIAVLATAGSPEAARVDAALGWAGRGYWQDVRQRTAAATADRAASTSHGDDVAEALARGGGRAPAHPEDLRAVEVAAALELLDSPGRAPLRLVVRHRPPAGHRHQQGVGAERDRLLQRVGLDLVRPPPPGRIEAQAGPATGQGTGDRRDGGPARRRSSGGSGAGGVRGAPRAPLGPGRAAPPHHRYSPS
ncbi:hypothetical protein ACIQ9M_30585 [Streptomyces californicus]|uniref:hypothetical protein n=1 Tax=Streptomyces californicus TaxID=67351 RepID=UPI0036CD8844